MMDREEVLAQLAGLSNWLQAVLDDDDYDPDFLRRGAVVVDAAIRLLEAAPLEGWQPGYNCPPVPDGERVAEYERLLAVLLETAFVAGRACDYADPQLQDIKAALDAFVLPLLAQPAASEPEFCKECIRRSEAEMRAGHMCSIDEFAAALKEGRKARCNCGQIHDGPFGPWLLAQPAAQQDLAGAPRGLDTRASGEGAGEADADDPASVPGHAARQDALRTALESIAANTCCEGCGEAARVARAALADTEPPHGIRMDEFGFGAETEIKP